MYRLREREEKRERERERERERAGEIGERERERVRKGKRKICFLFSIHFSAPTSDQYKLYRTQFIKTTDQNRFR